MTKRRYFCLRPGELEVVVGNINVGSVSLPPLDAAGVCASSPAFASTSPFSNIGGPDAQKDENHTTSTKWQNIFNHEK